MIIKKVHYSISFKQRKWLSPYIQFNTEKRSAAKSKFEIEYFKLMNNAFYGKTCENIRNRKEVVLTTDKDEALNMHANPRFYYSKVFDHTTQATIMRKNIHQI